MTQKVMNPVKIEKHIGTLDGIRAIAMTLVVWFHFWQQSWLTPVVRLPERVVEFTKYIGVKSINLEGFVRYGFVFVDMLILLSAFCNFYPYARALLLGEPWPDTKTFYKRRAARILPSYYFSLLVMLIVLWKESGVFQGSVFRDLCAHLLCLSPLFPGSHLFSYFSGVLWTVQMEVLYYIAMPWLAKLFRRWPALTCLGLWGVGIFSANYIAYNCADRISIYCNQILSFAGCYANGMILAVIYIQIKKNGLENTITRLAATMAFIFSILHLNDMLHELGRGELQIVQLQQRFELSLVFSVILLALPFACKGLKILFDNRLLRFVAAISYNWYLWHQYLAVKLKEYRIPYWMGDTPPNITGDKVWMWKYQILIVVVSVLVAFVLTYGLERPVAKLLLKNKKKAAPTETAL